MPSLHIAQELKDVISDLMHPVGSVYIAVDDTDPSTLFYGSWTRIVDGYLFCGATGYAGGAQSNLQNSTRTAGHALTVSQMPKHNHRIPGPFNDKISPAVRDYVPYGGWSTSSFYVMTQDQGDGAAHYHNVPTTAVAVWKRTA